jgi:hypothetical protein
MRFECRDKSPTESRYSARDGESSILEITPVLADLEDSLAGSPEKSLLERAHRHLDLYKIEFYTIKTIEAKSPTS